MKYIIYFIFFFLNSFLYSEININPISSLSVYGGKYYFDGDSSDLNLNADLFFSPVIILDENNEIYPVYIGNYYGTQSIEELAGGDVLTRERQNHTISFKYVKIDDFNKIKPRISYSKALVKETKDEKWGKGLFDYNNVSAGIEFEQEKPYGTFKESYDFYSVSYPNYASLISQSETIIDTTTFKELSTNSGTNILNNINHRLSFSYIFFPKEFISTFDFAFTYRAYSDQPLIGVLGNFESEKRKDMVYNLDFKIEKPSDISVLSLITSINYLNSNQNSYDASRTKYIDNYYSYIEGKIGPSLNFNFKNKSSFGYSLTYSKIFYIGRLSQDENGNYNTSKINQEFWLNSLYFKYPLLNNFFAKSIYSYETSNSNMKYEAGYKYNYRASSFLLGIEWEF